ncbi:MAG: M20/M25/M40 family metallo-hydrolase [Pyrinomonadaceae bacterium]|nr:M20/M25/M40 family metallo-hydrolase [Pyrinomonadaceae bacterium]
MKIARQVLLLVLLQLLVLFVPQSLGAEQSEIKISTLEQIKADFDSVPCKNEDRLKAVKTLFEKMGATSSDMSVDKYKDVENLVVKKPGSSQEKIIIGAHYDKVAEGCGALDNWSGIVTMAHLYKSLKTYQFKKTILFVAFGKEESGRVGSRAMADGIAKDQVAQYCEMINIDSLGLAGPQVADNMSSKKLSDLTAGIAKEMKLPFSHANIEGANSDSTSFIAKNIPSLTIHGMSNDWASILHSANDQASKVNPNSVYLGYRLVLILMVYLDNSPCGEYR